MSVVTCVVTVCLLAAGVRRPARRRAVTPASWGLGLATWATLILLAG